MEDRRFDALAKVAAASSRRGLLAALAGGALALGRGGAWSRAARATTFNAFTACAPSAPSCNKPATQDQSRPHQVWCQPAGKCTDAHCSCHLFRTSKKTKTAEWFGKQNEKKEYDPDHYTYACSCGATTAAPAAVLPDLAYAAPFPGRDVSTAHQLAGGAFCRGLEACATIGALAAPVSGWVPAKADFVLFSQTLLIPAANGAQPPQSTFNCDVFLFNTPANAAQAKRNWTAGYGGATPIPATTKGWSLFGYQGTQHGGPFDAVAGMMALDHYFLVAQQTNYGSMVDRAAWATLPAMLSGHLQSVRAGTAPNLARFALDPFSVAQSEPSAWFGAYFALDGVYARTEGQTEAELAAQRARNQGLAVGYQGGFFAKNGSLATTTLRRFANAADQTAFLARATTGDRRDAVTAGFVAAPFDPIALPGAGITANLFGGIDPHGAPAALVDLGDALAVRLAFDDGAVTAPKGRTLADAYRAALEAGMTAWALGAGALLEGGPPALAPGPVTPPAMSLLDDLERLDGVCKTDLTQCAM